VKKGGDKFDSNQGSGGRGQRNSVKKFDKGDQYLPKSHSSNSYQGPTLEIDDAAMGKKLMENFSSYCLYKKEQAEIEEGQERPQLSQDFFKIYNELTTVNRKDGA
jgi:hypothetical protein